MKKIILCMGAVAVVALAAFNLNLSLNKEAKVNVEFASTQSVAQNEGGEGKCNQQVYMTPIDDCWFHSIYYCTSDGSSPRCLNGWSDMNFCDDGWVGDVFTLDCN